MTRQRGCHRVCLLGYVRSAFKPLFDFRSRATDQLMNAAPAISPCAPRHRDSGARGTSGQTAVGCVDAESDPEAGLFSATYSFVVAGRRVSDSDNITAMQPLAINDLLFKLCHFPSQTGRILSSLQTFREGRGRGWKSERLLTFNGSEERGSELQKHIWIYRGKNSEGGQAGHRFLDT